MSISQRMGNDLETVTNSAICGLFLSNNSCSIYKISTFFWEMNNIPNKNFVTLYPSDKRMRIWIELKRSWRLRVLAKQNWQTGLERLSTWLICMPPTKFSLLFLFYIRLQTFWMKMFEIYSYPINYINGKKRNKIW